METRKLKIDEPTEDSPAQPRVRARNPNDPHTLQMQYNRNIATAITAVGAGISTALAGIATGCNVQEIATAGIISSVSTPIACLTLVYAVASFVPNLPTENSLKKSIAAAVIGSVGIIIAGQILFTLAELVAHLLNSDINLSRTSFTNAHALGTIVPVAALLIGDLMMHGVFATKKNIPSVDIESGKQPLIKQPNL